MSDIAIRVENLGKRYTIGVGQRHDTLRDALADFRLRIADFGRKSPKSQIENPKSEEFWALKDVSFEVHRGEVVGVIGRNGAGKSTLLKILSRITEPTTGTAEIHGRVGSLLEVGTGFHPELTGRENIYLNGAILGMKRTEIDRKFDEIVAFSEIEKFLDTPVKRYSSGMYVRLAFAVAAHLEPEILLVDEVLAVGDAAFQKKCLGKMGDIAGEGRTVFFVSHNMVAIQALCSYAILLDHGIVLCKKETQNVINDYLLLNAPQNDRSLTERLDRFGSGVLRITDIRFGILELGNVPVFQSGQPALIALKYELRTASPCRNVKVDISLNYQDHALFFCSNEAADRLFDSLPTQGYFLCEIPRLPLPSGVYKLNFHCVVDNVVADHVDDAARIHVERGDFFGSGHLTPEISGSLFVPHHWQLVESGFGDL